MIALCVAKIGKRKFTITTTDMKSKLERPYYQEQQKGNYEAQLKAMVGARETDRFQQYLAGLHAAGRPAPAPSGWNKLF